MCASTMDLNKSFAMHTPVPGTPRLHAKRQMIWSHMINWTRLQATGGITVTAYKHIYFAYFSKLWYIFILQIASILTAAYTTQWAFQLIKYKHRMYKQNRPGDWKEQERFQYRETSLLWPPMGPNKSDFNGEVSVLSGQVPILCTFWDRARMTILEKLPY